MKNKLLALTIPLLACASVARPAGPQFSAERFRAHVAFLSGDLLEGRDTGSRGQEIGAVVQVARGMTPMEAIRSASPVAARYMGWGDRIGRLAPGYFGDLIAIEGDPLQDITRLQRVATVLKGGLVFKNAAVSRA